MENRPRRWWIAGLLSIVAFGLGQVYNGQPRKAVVLNVLIVVVFVAYGLLVLTDAFMIMTVAFVAVALVLWFGSLFDALVQSRKQQTYTLQPYNRVIVYVVYFVAAQIGLEVTKTIVKNQVVQAFRIPSLSMSPTLLAGDYVFADKRASARQPERGDIAVFQYPRDPRLQFLDRVVARGGETLELHDKTLLVNGQPVSEPFVVHMDQDVRAAHYDPRDNFGPTTVPEGSYFVMGDNRDNSNDSRFWGPLESRYVVGKVHGIYFSMDPGTKSIRWERIGKRPK